MISKQAPGRLPGLVVLLALIVSCGGAPGIPLPSGPTATPVGDIPFLGVQMGGQAEGQEIAFAVDGGRVSYLQVEGTDAYGNWRTWESDLSSPLTLLLTEGQLWRGTVVLLFDVEGLGRRRCVLDNLREAPGSTMASVIYTEGQGCSGEAGSIQDAHSTELLVEYMNPRDARQVVDAASGAVDAAGCIEGIARGLTGGAWGKAMIIKDCAGAAFYLINEKLRPYDLSVSDE